MNHLEQQLKPNVSVMLFAKDPGGINVIAAVDDALKSSGYCITVFSKDEGIGRFKSLFGIECKDFDKIDQEGSDQGLIKFLKRFNPALIITGTSASDSTEKMLWQCAKQLNIPTVAVLDQWMNLGIRFSKYAINEFEAYELKKTHECQPDYIMLMDEFSKASLVNLGFDESKLMVTGQPYFNYLRNHMMQDENMDDNVQRTHRQSKTILFASEPITETQSGRNGTFLWGYSELEILEHLLEAMNKAIVTVSSDMEITLIIRPHPKETSDKFNEFLTQYSSANFKIVIDQVSTSFELIKRADWVVGMSSMLLLEATLFERAVTSIQIGLNKDNPFVLDQLKINPSIINQQELESLCLKFVETDYMPVILWEGHTNAIENVLKGVGSILCRF